MARATPAAAAGAWDRRRGATAASEGGKLRKQAARIACPTLRAG